MPAQLRGLLLLDHAIDSVAPGRVEDAPSADPEGDVVCFRRRAIRDEVAGAEIGFRQPLRGRLLLVGVPRHEAAAGPERHVHEPGAIDARTRHPSPLVARIQERARMLDGIVRHGPEPVGITLAADVRAPGPARIPVIRLDENPAVALLEHPQRLACQGLCHLLGVVRRIRAKRRELARERMFA